MKLRARDLAPALIGGFTGSAIALATLTGHWTWAIALALAFVAFGLYWVSDWHLERQSRADNYRRWRARGLCFGCGTTWHGRRCNPYREEDRRG